MSVDGDVVVVLNGEIYNHPESGRYVDLTQRVVDAQVRPCSLTPAESHELVRHSVRASIQAHLLSEVPVAVFLSAGVDSAAVLGVASESGRVAAPFIGRLKSPKYASIFEYGSTVAGAYRVLRASTGLDRRR